ncbi:MAG: hypothetical protein CL533_18975 [Afipia sp.]|nr:hypothetical protein [Afipia sp.]OUX59635.1 MAG: hypothetical protein CBB64_18925 [Afipia sp. TMED4]HAQ93187.1 hypothetical protein [Afipia sp.]
MLAYMEKGPPTAGFFIEKHQRSPKVIMMFWPRNGTLIEDIFLTIPIFLRRGPPIAQAVRR